MVDTNQSKLVALDDAADFGFSANDVLAYVGASRQGQISWHDGTTATVTVEHQATATTRAQLQPIDPAYVSDHCLPSLSISDVAITLSTDDGQLNEQVTATLTALAQTTSVTWVFTSFNLDRSEIQGGFEPPAQWSDPAMPEEKFRFHYDISETGGLQSGCAPGETQTSDPTDSCNTSDGLLTFSRSTDPGDPENWHAEVEGVASWIWD